eukprot:5354548-Prymnesium_polylepis.1
MRVHVRVQCLCAVLGVLTWGEAARAALATGVPRTSHPEGDTACDRQACVCSWHLNRYRYALVYALSTRTVELCGSLRRARMNA